MYCTAVRKTIKVEAPDSRVESGSNMDAGSVCSQRSGPGMNTHDKGHHFKYSLVMASLEM